LIPAKKAAKMESERRRAPRYFVIADAQVTDIASGAKLSAKTSDLSASGCFLDMMNPSPEGSEVELRISHAGDIFTVRGKVVFQFPNMGMGVMFTSMEGNHRKILQKWLADFGGPQEM
jgi:Ribonuclease G/E